MGSKALTYFTFKTTYTVAHHLYNILSPMAGVNDNLLA